jgi:hypothetical protein
MSEAAAIVQRVWNYCNVLRDDDVSYFAIQHPVA